MKRLIALAAALGMMGSPLAAADKKEPAVTARFTPLAGDFYVSPQIGPEDIAAAVAYLASPAAGYITGAVLHVNGGMYLS